MALPSETSKRFIWNEARLVEFYHTGEPESTETYKFLNVHQPITISKSEKAGQGLFLRDPVAPGQLLIVSNAIASCACIREYGLYEEGPYVHAPKAAWKPQRPRIPPEVHQHLANKLARVFDTADEEIMGLDSHDPKGSQTDFSSHGNRKSSRQGEPETISLNGSKTDDLPRRLVNIVANNAMCTKVRSLRNDELKQVETCDLWGVWSLPSYINHSCAPNCNRMRVGEAIFIRSATNIAAGDELTLPYFDIFEPLTFREANSQTFDFRCECRRCTFERSLGKPYEDIQRQIVQLKIQLETEWTLNVRGSRGQVDMLLEKLGGLMFPTFEMISLDGLYTKRPKRHRTSTKRGSKLQKKNLDSRMYETKKFWIHASFIDAHIANYALFATRTATDIETARWDPRMLMEERSRVCQIEEGKTEQRTIAAVLNILDIICHVHPGNMLGQEFISILLKGLSRLAKCDNSGNAWGSTVEKQESLKLDAIDFYSWYYGSCGGSRATPRAILEELLAIES